MAAIGVEIVRVWSDKGALVSVQTAVRGAAPGVGAPLSRPALVQWASWFSEPEE